MGMAAISPQAKALFDQFRLLKPPIGSPVSLDAEREKTRHAEEMTGMPEGVHFERERLGGVSGIWCVPEKLTDDFQCVYLHGGAFALMSATTHARMAGYLANACRAKVFVPSYRLAPEHPFPQGLRDCVKVVEATMAKSNGRPVVLAGDSAGGGLAVSTALVLRDDGKTMPACLVLMSPWLDLAHRSPSIARNAELDASLRDSNLKYFADLYLNGTDPKHPLASPLYADCRSLPPTYVQGAEHDLVVDDGTRFAELLDESGVSVRSEIFKNMQHSFQFFAGRIPEADKALRKAASYVREHLTRQP